MSDTQPILAQLAEDAKDATIRKQDSALGCSMLCGILAIDKMFESVMMSAQTIGLSKSTLEVVLLANSIADKANAAMGLSAKRSRPWIRVDDEETLRKIAELLEADIIENGTTMTVGVEGVASFNHTRRKR